jgi:competence protein ComEC
MPLELLYIPAQAMADQRQLFLSLSPGGLALGLAAVAACVAVLPLSRWQCLLVPVLLLPLLLGRPASGEGPRLDVLDTGQGTAVVFSASGRALLYDTGGGEPGGPNIANSVVLPWLRLSAIHALQTLVISHDDLDHSAGALDILDAMAVEQVLVGESLLPGARACRTGLAWQWPGAIRFRVLSPGGAEAGNEASCVLLIDTPDLRILLAGDIGVAQERELIRYWGPQLRSDVLLVGHHGSATSTSQAWLNHVAPQLAVVTAGYASRFGHPHNDVLARLAGQGISVRETAREGALTIRRGRLGELQVAAHRDGYRPWWM